MVPVEEEELVDEDDAGMDDEDEAKYRNQRDKWPKVIFWWSGEYITTAPIVVSIYCSYLTRKRNHDVLRIIHKK